MFPACSLANIIMINFGGMKKYLSLFLFILLAVAANAKIVPAKLFQDGMVLQRGKTIKVWGTASPRESFVVSIGKNNVGVVADESPKAIVARVLRRIAEQQISAVHVTGFRAQVAAIGNLDSVPSGVRQVGSKNQADEHREE